MDLNENSLFEGKSLGFFVKAMSLILKFKHCSPLVEGKIDWVELDKKLNSVSWDKRAEEDAGKATLLKKLA